MAKVLPWIQLMKLTALPGPPKWTWQRGKGEKKREDTKGEESGLAPKKWAVSALPEMQLPPAIVGWLCACCVLVNLASREHAQATNDDGRSRYCATLIQCSYTCSYYNQPKYHPEQCQYYE